MCRPFLGIRFYPSIFTSCPVYVWRQKNLCGDVAMHPSLRPIPKGDGVFTKASSLLYAAVAELADALDSGSSESNFIRVQVPSAAPGKTPVTMSFGMVTGVFMFYFRACFCALLPFAPLVISERCFRAFSNVITTASFFWRLRHMRIALISADLIIHLSSVPHRPLTCFTLRRLPEKAPGT